MNQLHGNGAADRRSVPETLPGSSASAGGWPGPLKATFGSRLKSRRWRMPVPRTMQPVGTIFRQTDSAPPRQSRETEMKAGKAADSLSATTTPPSRPPTRFSTT